MKLAAVGAALSGGAFAASDEQPICADRPGKGDATCTAPAGHWQIETALADWTVQRAPDERDTSLAIASTAIKYGATERSHIELDVTPYVRTTSRAGGANSRASGIGDMTVRYKHQLSAPGAAVQVTLFPFVKLPTAKRALGNGKIDAGIELPVAYAIPHSALALALAPQLGWFADQDGSGHHPAMVQTASLGWQATPTLNVSGELWGQWDWDPSGTGKQVSADGAVAYLARDNLQLDAGANFGLNRQTPSVELYAGVSRRF